jgi:hypothetical protein
MLLFSLLHSDMRSRAYQSEKCPCSSHGARWRDLAREQSLTAGNEKTTPAESPEAADGIRIEESRLHGEP